MKMYGVAVNFDVFAESPEHAFELVRKHVHTNNPVDVTMNTIDEPEEDVEYAQRMADFDLIMFSNVCANALEES